MEASPDEVTYAGGCLCGAVRYTWQGEPLQVTHCHCTMCQRQHGAMCATYARIPRTRLHIESRADQIASYASSPPVTRRFCKTCGSSLFFDYEPRPDLCFVTVGTLDDSSSIKPSRHIFTCSRPAWFTMSDDLPEYDEYP